MKIQYSTDIVQSESEQRTTFAAICAADRAGYDTRALRRAWGAANVYDIPYTFDTHELDEIYEIKQALCAMAYSYDDDDDLVINDEYHALHCAVENIWIACYHAISNRVKANHRVYELHKIAKRALPESFARINALLPASQVIIARA